MITAANPDQPSEQEKLSLAQKMRYLFQLQYI